MAISFPISLRSCPRPASYPGKMRRLGVAAGIALLAAVGMQPASASSAGHKQQALEQFAAAEQMRAELDQQSSGEHTRKDYKRVAEAFRRVYYLAPTSSKADASVAAVADILTLMGRQFQPGEKDLREAIAHYEFLRREYPGSKYRMQALLNIGQIYQQDLRDDDAARHAFGEFLQQYPRNSLALQARQALAELNAPKPEAPVVADKPDKTETAASEGFVPVSGKKLAELPVVTGVRHWSTPDYTRVAIDIDSEVKYEAGRVANPDRIFFDLPNTRLTAALRGKTFDVHDGFLKKIRAAQFQPGYTRVVLEVADVSDYSAFLLPNPYRLIIDIHGRQRAAETETATATNSPADAPVTDAHGSTPEKSYTSVQKAYEAGNKRKVVDNDDDGTTAAATNRKHGAQPSATSSSSADSSEIPNATGKAPRSAGTHKSSDPLFSSTPDAGGPELKATTEPTTAPTAVAVAPRAKSSRNSSKTAIIASPVHEAEPTSDGDRSLTRALGLKIGRIVIDPGHGGHDTGTIGPDGLTEKEVVLDVALRLGRLLESHLGAEVIYTRRDDTFIPLETRTAIANQHQADLFISIHANSSEDADARGVETYYLNFTSDPAALEVAARENALSQKSIYQLQDLVKKITLKEKIEESHELATDVQQSLYGGLATRRSTLRDRGVKKAPFVVLIGANMPSILAEISFVSNPTDEEKMGKPDYRQKISESIYKGIAKYASGLSGIKLASRFDKDAGQ